MRRIIAAAIIKEDKILIAKRNYGALDGYWEFPGGKVEDSETDVICLTREIMEEFAAELKVEKLLGEQQFFVDKEEYILALYRAVLLNNNLRLRVHSEIAWVEKGKLQNYKLAPVDKILVQKGYLEGLA